MENAIYEMPHEFLEIRWFLEKSRGIAFLQAELVHPRDVVEQCEIFFVDDSRKDSLDEGEPDENITLR